MPKLMRAPRSRAQRSIVSCHLDCFAVGSGNVVDLDPTTKTIICDVAGDLSPHPRIPERRVRDNLSHRQEIKDANSWSAAAQISRGFASVASPSNSEYPSLGDDETSRNRSSKTTYIHQEESASSGMSIDIEAFGRVIHTASAKLRISTG